MFRFPIQTPLRWRTVMRRGADCQPALKIKTKKKAVANDCKSIRSCLRHPGEKTSVTGHQQLLTA